MMKNLVAAVAATGVIFAGSTAVHVSAEEYEVQNQDTLWGIANKYDTSVDHLMDINDLGSTIIYPGQNITTDAEGSSEIYIVEKGDTLNAIAGKYDVEVDDIMDWNDLTDTLINIDQKLEIKGVASSNTAEASAVAEETPVAEVEEAPATEEAPAPETEEAPKAETEGAPATETTEAPAAEAEKTAPASSESSNGSGETVSVTATAYTAGCAGCSGVTSTGIDLNANPNKKVIAVDPNVIPLGSEVHVEGYGNAIAADTGGAINGNKIDVHVPSKSDAMNWGVKTVNVTVLD